MVALVFAGAGIGAALRGFGAPLAATVTAPAEDVDALLVYLPSDAVEVAIACLSLFLVGFLAALFAMLANSMWQNAKHLFRA